MAKNNGFADKLQDFADRVKKEPAQLPVQKVTPVQVTNNTKGELQQLNVWIPKGLMKRLKAKGLDVEKSLKDMTIEALTQYL